MKRGRIPRIRGAGPKRPQSAFLYYAADRRPSLRIEQPGLSVTDTCRVLGEEWNQLDDEVKTPYNEMARVDRERYNQEKAWV